jgi:hypothetical protein
MNMSTGSFTSRFNYFLMAIGLLALLSLSSPSLAGMRWSARAIDPSLIDAMRGDRRLLEETFFGEPPKSLTEKLMNGDHSDQTMDEFRAWSAKRKADVGDTQVDLDKAWDGIDYLLTGQSGIEWELARIQSTESNITLASKVSRGSEDIGPDLGYGPARLLKPHEVRAIAKLLRATTPDMLRKRFKPKEMAHAGVYPDVIWERDGAEALGYVLDYYEKLVAFYTLAAQRGQAVILVIH